MPLPLYNIYIILFHTTVVYICASLTRLLFMFAFLAPCSVPGKQ